METNTNPVIPFDVDSLSDSDEAALLAAIAKKNEAKAAGVIAEIHSLQDQNDAINERLASLILWCRARNVSIPRRGKDATPASDAAEQADPNMPKRKRGRPAKNASESQSTVTQ